MVMALALALAPTAAAQVRMYQEWMGVPFHGSGSIWTTPLASDAPIDPESSNLVAVLDQWFPGPTGNHANFTVDNGVNWWIADGTTPYVTVTTKQLALQQVFNQVPIPAGAHPSLNSDSRMAVLQPSSGCAWDFWHIYQAADGSWSAAWGGRVCHIWSDPGVYRNVQDAVGNVLEQNTWGGPATGFPDPAGAMMVDELAHGLIPHAVSFALDKSANCHQLWSQPAERTDGEATPILDANGEPTNCVPEGAQFRLPPPCPVGVASTPGVCFNVSDLAGDPPIVQELAQAAQTYGLVDENSTSGGVVATESGNPGTPPYEVLGANPYTTAIPSEPNTPFLGSYANQPALALFPWTWLELLQMHVTSTSNPTVYIEPDPPGLLWPN